MIKKERGWLNLMVFIFGLLVLLLRVFMIYSVHKAMVRFYGDGFTGGISPMAVSYGTGPFLIIFLTGMILGGIGCWKYKKNRALAIVGMACMFLAVPLPILVMVLISNV
ncbi:hypothetical protein FUAX_38020 [Fulvitalea axinellae]|uniref:Uncharacterized protein n=1 Tax=Fulvitalea axinellae TaxID=1182444 RepID=A0AAU9DFR0_9BACT|nr:hypothetical protein FUAX_38020 [Fulvitalea axinellae]